MRALNDLAATELALMVDVLTAKCPLPMVDPTVLATEVGRCRLAWAYGRRSVLLDIEAALKLKEKGVA